MEQNTKRGRRMLWIIALVFVAVSALLFGLSKVHFSPSAGKSMVTGEAQLRAKDLQNENGRFVILEYPDYDVSEYVQLSDYKNMTVEVDPLPEVTEHDIDLNVESYLTYHQIFEQITEDIVKRGDRVVVSCDAYLDGERLDDYCIDNSMELLTDEYAPEEFLAAFDGAAIGEEVEFDMSFDESWSDEVVAGKTLHFIGVVTARLVVPTLTDENIGEYMDGQYQTVAEFRNYLEEEIRAYDQSCRDQAIADEVMSQLMNDTVVVAIPSVMTKWYMSTQMVAYQSQADVYGVSVEKYLSMQGLDVSIDDFVQGLAKESEPVIRKYMVFAALAKAEQLDIDEANEDDLLLLEARYADLMSSYNLSTKDELDAYYHKSNVQNDVLMLKTLQWCMENVTVVDKVSEDGN